ncbi:MAG: hypothetical protein HY744_28955 [Deltaproteobacteria bacterium]|nr:hypothetical protein [Deltaproteobacteria bacterium]
MSRGKWPAFWAARRRGRTPLAWAGIAAFCVAAFGACGIDPEFVRAGSAKALDLGEVTVEQIRIRTGIAIGVRVTDDGEALDADAEVDMGSSAPEILSVAPTLESDVFVVWGVRPGSATVTLRVDGDQWEIPAVVVDP